MRSPKLASAPRTFELETLDEQHFLNFPSLVKKKIKALRDETKPLSYCYIK